jgi:hypothetical protein
MNLQAAKSPRLTAPKQQSIRKSMIYQINPEEEEAAKEAEELREALQVPEAVQKPRNDRYVTLVDLWFMLC